MVNRQASSTSTKSIAGAILLSFGLLLLFANLDEVAARVSDCSSFASPAGAVGTVLELGLTACRAAQVYFFDPSRFQSSLQQILLSFWPLILVIVGAVLLRDAFKRLFAASAASSSPEREVVHG